MNFYDLPRLESLRISNNTPVTGDLRNLKDCDFPALKELSLPKSIVGGASFQFDSVADAPEVMNALCRLKSRNGTDIDSGFIPCHPYWRENHFPSWRLSDRSIEHYPMDPFSLLIPPFQIEIVEAGPRVGWRWTNHQRNGACETNWIDIEPQLEGSESAELQLLQYRAELQLLQNDVQSYRGFMCPPTATEYQRMTTHW